MNATRSCPNNFAACLLLDHCETANCPLNSHRKQPVTTVEEQAECTATEKDRK